MIRLFEIQRIKDTLVRSCFLFRFGLLFIFEERSHNVACCVDHTGHIDQAGLDLTGLFLPLPSKCWADTWL